MNLFELFTGYYGLLFLAVYLCFSYVEHVRYRNKYETFISYRVAEFTIYFYLLSYLLFVITGILKISASILLYVWP
jgi:hypothetical protein